MTTRRTTKRSLTLLAILALALVLVGAMPANA